MKELDEYLLVVQENVELSKILVINRLDYSQSSE